MIFGKDRWSNKGRPRQNRGPELGEGGEGLAARRSTGRRRASNTCHRWNTVERSASFAACSNSPSSHLETPVNPFDTLRAQSTYSSRRLTDHLRCNFKQVIEVWFLSDPQAALPPGCGLI